MNYDDFKSLMKGLERPAILPEGTRALPEEDRGHPVASGEKLAWEYPESRFRTGNAPGSDEAFAGGVGKVDSPPLQCARILFTLVLWGCLLTTSCHRAYQSGSDLAWYDQQAFGSLQRPSLYSGVDLTSQYLTMRDGVRIAVDLCLPQGLTVGTRIPTILMQTRYVRAMQYRWPFSLFVHGRFDNLIRYFVTRGYAWVYVDVRGSGASFGTRAYPYAPEEILDGTEVADWIVRQPWSDGRIGSMGSSYDGDAAVFLLTTQHPAVKAIMPRYAYFDAYPDVIRPGGVHLSWLTRTWASLGEALDADRISDFIGWRAGLAVKGVRPVDEDKDGRLLAAAIAEHAANGDIAAQAREIHCRDDRARPIGRGIEAISPHARLAAIRQTGAAVYLYTGWFDSSYVLAEINFFRSIEGQPRKLTIGPWDHGGWCNISPYARKSEPLFDAEAEAFRFFDAELGNAPNGFHTEKPVSYFTMGEEKWKFADTWPPAGARTVSYYFSQGNSLSPEAPVPREGADTYRVDFNAGTGTSSRWVSLVNPLHKPIRYPDRREEDRRLLCYDSAPLEQPMEVTGHPVVTLHVDSTADDGAFFCYLEDVAPDGRVTYITEGMLRAIHRKLSNVPPPYPMPVPYRTFLRQDAIPLTPGRTAELVFDLYPTSYLYRQGHRIRIALAGADKDHFAFIPNEPPTVRVHRSAEAASRIDLPVMPATRSAAP